MAKDNEQIKDQAVKQEATAEKPAKNNSAKVVNIRPEHKPWVYATGAVVLVLIVFALGMSVSANRHHEMVFGTKGAISAGAMPGGEFGSRMGGGERHFVTGGNFGSDGSDTTGQTRLIGVATAVNGSTITVAGDGTTTQVTTNTSTDYVNGSAVKQNDSVIVMGTKSGDSVTATRIVINP